MRCLVLQRIDSILLSDGYDNTEDCIHFYGGSFCDVFARNGATKKLVNEANEAKRYVGMCCIFVVISCFITVTHSRAHRDGVKQWLWTKVLSADFYLFSQTHCVCNASPKYMHHNNSFLFNMIADSVALCCFEWLI